MVEGIPQPDSRSISSTLRESRLVAYAQMGLGTLITLASIPAFMTNIGLGAGVLGTGMLTFGHAQRRLRRINGKS